MNDKTIIDDEGEVQFSARIPASLRARAKAKAALERTSLQSVVVELLLDWVGDPDGEDDGRQPRQMAVTAPIGEQHR